MKKFVYLFVLTIILYGCKDSPVTTSELPVPPPPPPPPAKVAYILNEGNFGDPFGARLSKYNIDDDTVYYNVFESANAGIHLGSTGDDLQYSRGRLYALMSGSMNLVVIRESDLKITQTMYFNSTPHDLVIDSNRSKAYITRLYSNSIYVMNLAGFVLEDSINVGNNPQGMLIVDSQLYVCNSGYGADSTVSVIDVNADTLKATITVGDGPSGVAALKNGKVVVACTGNAFGTPPTNGRLVIINPSTNTIEDTIDLTENLFGNIAVGFDGSVYVLGVTSGSYFGGPVHRLNPDTKVLTMSFIAGTYYSIAVEQAEDEIYVSDVKQFTADGEVQIYKKDGTLKKFFTAQKGPSVIVFKR